MAEATLSVLIVGVVLVAALNTVGAAGRGRQRTADRARGTLLAQDLMSEILQQAYEDPDDAPGSFGLGYDEVGDGSRSLWEDVDDYDGWFASPPQNKDGTLIEGFEDWVRSVTVDWVRPDALDQPVSYDTRVKRVVVTAAHHDVPVACLVAVRTAAWLDQVGDVNADPENHLPTAVAQGAPLSGRAKLLVNFFAGGSSDPDPEDAATLTYAWDFGDGTTGSGMAITHSYNQGVYTATLTVSDGRGGAGTATLTVNVWD